MSDIFIDTFVIKMNIILIVIVLQYSNWIAVLSENNLNQFKKHNESGLYNLVHSGDGTLENLFSDADFPKNGDIPLLNRKIVKGTRVTINEHPYIVSIRRHFSHYLMGAIILKNVVISVAHPLYRVSPTELHTVCGENYSDRGTYLFTVLLVVIHEDYNPLTLEGDLALLRLYEDIIYRISIKAISLVSPILPLDGQTGFVTGWGRCDRTGKELCLPRSSIFFKREKYDSMLRTVTFTLNTSNPYCDPYYKDTKVNDGMICLGDARETDWICPCLAVPGAPLVVGARLVALQSWGFGCGYTKDLPLMYTNLQYYQPWLVHNIPILRTITHDNLTELFEATKAQMLTEWLHRTRHLVPFIKQPALHEINPLLVDTKLSLLWGTVYDVRDFIFFGTFHESKLNLYREMEQKSINLKRPDPMTLVRREKFLNNDTLKDSGLFIVNGTLHEIESDETTYDSYISTVTTASTRNITFYLESL